MPRPDLTSDQTQAAIYNTLPPLHRVSDSWRRGVVVNVVRRINEVI